MHGVVEGNNKIWILQLRQYLPIYEENCLVEKAEYVERIGLFYCDNYMNDLFK